MAALTITAASVVAGSNAIVENGTAGDTITAGQVVYLDTATGRYELADCNSATLAVRQARGIALNGAADGQPLRILKSGDITIGATMTVGAAYYLSGTAGAIIPVADLATSDYVVFLGIAKTAAILGVDIQYSGAQVPA
jgi:hypothetical protein